MARSLRTEIIQQHTHRTAPAHARVLGAWRFSPRHLLGALLFTLLTLLPSLWRIEPLPYHLGHSSPTDIVARLPFEHQPGDDPEGLEELRLFPMYEEVPLSRWMRVVFSPVVGLIEHAADVRDPDTLFAYAEQEGIPLTREQAMTLTDFLLQEQNRNLYSDILEPMRRILEAWLHPRGVMTEERYQAELEATDTPTIEVTTGSEREEFGRIIRILPGGGVGPVGAAEARRLLDRGFYDELWVIRRSVRQVLADLLAAQIERHPSLVYDEALTRETGMRRREAHVESLGRVARGDILLRRGERATGADLARLRAERHAFRMDQGLTLRLLRPLGKGVLLFLVAAVFAGMFARMRPACTNRVLVAVAGLGLLLVAGAYVLMHMGLPGVFLPVGLLVAVAALLLGSMAGVLVTFAAGFYLFILYEGQVGLLGATLAGGGLLSAYLPNVRFRQNLIPLVNVCGILAALVMLALFLFDGGVPSFDVFGEGLFDFAGGGDVWIRMFWVYMTWMLTGVLILLLLPLVPRLFGECTLIQIQDLQDQEHPCLRQLLIEAPSTYHHSLLVGTLAESAASAIGANALLCKVGSYYHDIGKLIKPEYFTENESGISRHDGLAPSISKLIIINHVRDGAEMARVSGLPRSIIDIIEQHHGTTRVTYFLNRAIALAEDPDDIDPASFRYPGPRPRTAEAAIIMVADSVEAASRSLEQAAPAQIRKMVHGIILAKLEDRQFDESPLTLSDLDKIEDAIVHLLASMLHSRIKYPGASGSGKKEDRPSRRT